MRDRLVGLASGLAVLALLIAAWKAYVSWFDVSRFLLPPPEDVWSAFLTLLGDGETWDHVSVTAQEIVGGFALATVSGVATGILLAEVRPLERALTPFLVVLQVIPKVAVIPVLLLWLGFGMSSKLVVAAIFAFLPVTASTLAGLKAVESGHRDLARVFQASRRQRLAYIDLPGTLPAMLTGMEIGIVLATIGAVVAEYLAGAEGLGYLIVRSLNQVRVPDLFAVIAILSLLGLVLYFAVVSLRRILIPWHGSVRRHDRA